MYKQTVKNKQSCSKSCKISGVCELFMYLPMTDQAIFLHVSCSLQKVRDERFGSPLYANDRLKKLKVGGI